MALSLARQSKRNPKGRVMYLQTDTKRIGGYGKGTISRGRGRQAEKVN